MFTHSLYSSTCFNINFQKSITDFDKCLSIFNPYGPNTYKVQLVLDDRMRMVQIVIWCGTVQRIRIISLVQAIKMHKYIW